MFFALLVCQRHELLKQQRVLKHPLDGLDEVRLQSGGMLLGGVPGIQESLESFVSFSYKQRDNRPLEEHSRMNSIALHFVFNGLTDQSTSIILLMPFLNKNPNASVGQAPSCQPGFSSTAVTNPAGKGTLLSCQESTVHTLQRNAKSNVGMSDFKGTFQCRLMREMVTGT